MRDDSFILIIGFGAAIAVLVVGAFMGAHMQSEKVRFAHEEKMAQIAASQPTQHKVEVQP